MPAFRPLQLIHKTLFTFTIIALVCSCNQKKNRSNKQLSSQTDSIKIWLTAADKDQISKTTMAVLSEKAYVQTKKLTNDTLKNKYLARLSILNIMSDESSKFRQINREAMLSAFKLKDSSGLANLHWDLGYFFDKKAIQRDSAFYHYNESEKIFSALGDKKSCGKILLQKAWLQNLTGDYTGSNITAIRAAKKLKSLNSYESLRNCYTLLGDNAKLLNEYEKSLEFYDESLNYLRKESPDPLKEIKLKNSFGLVYQKKGDHQKAISYFLDALSFDSLRNISPSLYTRTLSNLGSSYLKTNKLDQLPLLFTTAIGIQDSISDMGGKSSSTYRLAEYYLHINDTAKAAMHLQVAKTLNTQRNNNKSLLETLRMFTLVDPKNASNHAAAAFSFGDSLQIQERQIRNKFARIAFETDEFIAENQLLSRQNQLWIGIAAALLLLSLSAFIIIRQRIKNQKLRFEEQQQASNQEIFNLLLAQNEKVEEGKKSEQKRVSEELHDGVLGRMLGARMMLLGLNKKTDPQAMAERGKAISMLQDVEGEVRSISHELSHTAYQKIHNFILSIKDLLQSVENSSKIIIDFSYADDLDYDALTGEIKINLYRIIQESVQNAVKHAACKHINISFGANSELLSMVITDDGKGFVVKKGKKGIGTRNITSRVKKVNGTWQVDSLIGKGTSVRVQIPIVANDNTNDIRIPQAELQEF